MITYQLIYYANMQSNSVKIHRYPVGCTEWKIKSIYKYTTVYNKYSNNLIFLEYGDQTSLVFVANAIVRDHTEPGN